MTATTTASPPRRSVYITTECQPEYNGGIRPVQRVHCDIRPECAGCKVSGHGFICHFSDGTCVKLPHTKAAAPSQTAICYLPPKDESTRQKHTHEQNGSHAG